MAKFLVATATTNTTRGSIVQVRVKDLICSLRIVPNEFGDELPIIPTAARTENNKVLYQIKLKAKLVQHVDGKAVAGHALVVASNRSHDHISSSGCTDANGEVLLTVESRECGTLRLNAVTGGVTLSPFELKLKDAWYQSKFLITGYNVCAEADFSGALVSGTGLDEKHREDFLFGAAGVPMQGTGKATDDRYIRLQAMVGGWHTNRAGHPDRVNSQAGVSFSYADNVMGAFSEVKEEHSIAVDPYVIPKQAKVSIDGVGDRFADDRGSAIHAYHIDNFLGAGKEVVTAWLHGGVNGTQRRVKYLGAGE